MKKFALFPIVLLLDVSALICGIAALGFASLGELCIKGAEVFCRWTRYYD